MRLGSSPAPQSHQSSAHLCFLQGKDQILLLSQQQSWPFIPASTLTHLSCWRTGKGGVRKDPLLSPLASLHRGRSYQMWVPTRSSPRPCCRQAEKPFTRPLLKVSIQKSSHPSNLSYHPPHCESASDLKQ